MALGDLNVVDACSNDCISVGQWTFTFSIDCSNCIDVVGLALTIGVDIFECSYRNEFAVKALTILINIVSDMVGWCRSIHDVVEEEHESFTFVVHIVVIIFVQSFWHCSFRIADALNSEVLGSCREFEFECSVAKPHCSNVGVTNLDEALWVVVGH